MIGSMDRKAAFYNPTVIKSASGGTTNTWAQWGEYWCEWKQNSGSKSDAGSQRNLSAQASIQIRYSDLVGQRLNKDSVVIIRDVQYNVTDFKIDHRQKFVQIEIVEKKATGATLISQNDLLVQSRIFTISDEAGETTFTVPWLLNKTVLSVISGRAFPYGVITEGTPAANRLLFTASTAQCEVNADAVLVEGEEFEFLFR